MTDSESYPTRTILTLAKPVRFHVKHTVLCLINPFRLCFVVLAVEYLELASKRILNKTPPTTIQAIRKSYFNMVSRETIGL